MFRYTQPRPYRLVDTPVCLSARRMIPSFRWSPISRGLLSVRSTLEGRWCRSNARDHPYRLVLFSGRIPLRSCRFRGSLDMPELRHFTLLLSCHWLCYRLVVESYLLTERFPVFTGRSCCRCFSYCLSSLLGAVTAYPPLSGVYTVAPRRGYFWGARAQLVRIDFNILSII